MQCEICGATIKGRPKKVKIERSVLEACSKCAELGTETRTHSPVSKKINPEKPNVPRKRRRSRGGRRDMYDKMGGLVDEYGAIIREAREDDELTQEELASKINEKASLIRKIEREDILPDSDVQKKIERALDISLSAESSGVDDYESQGGGGGVTLGDIAQIKRK